MTTKTDETLLDWVIRRLDKLSGPNDAGFYNAPCPSCKNNLSVKQLDDGSVYLQCWGASYQCGRDDILDGLEGQPVLRKKVNAVRTTTSSLSSQKWAFKIYEERKPASGTPVEQYLLSRGIILDSKLRNVLAFHPNLKHRSGVWLPAMVAVVQGADGRPIGIHRTWLQVTSTTVRKAEVDPNKMAFGPISGGVVALYNAGTKIALAEGIESAMSFTQLTKLPCWAGLGGNLDGVVLLPQFKEVVLAVDGDDAGDEYARKLGPRLAREGRKVRIAQAPRGQDWNDLLRGKSNGKSSRHRRTQASRKDPERSAARRA